MKTIKLILTNTLKLFRESLSIFLFILIGIIAASFGILFYSGYFINNHYETYYACEVDISLNNSVPPSVLKQLLAEIVDESSFNKLVMSDKEYFDSDIDILGAYYGNTDNFLLVGSEYSSNETSNVAFLSESIVGRMGYHRNITNEQITYAGKKLTVSGIHRGIYGFCVPPLYYIDNYDVRSIHVEFDDLISDKLKESFEAANVDYRITDNDSPFSSDDFVVSLAIILIIFSLSFVNILMMFSFWNIKMKQTFKVYYIYGCSRLQKFFIVSGQVFFISIIGTFIGSIIFACVCKPLGKLDIVYDGGAGQYISIVLITLAILLVFSVFWGIRSSVKQEKSFVMKEH